MYVGKERVDTRIIHHRKTTEKCLLFPDQGGENMKDGANETRKKKGDGDITTVKYIFVNFPVQYCFHSLAISTFISTLALKYP